ncbi:hypothetical protein GCM10027199_78810 [Amycolatopsis magusensis]
MCILIYDVVFTCPTRTWRASEPEKTYRYVDMVEIGSWFGVGHRAVATWRSRYADSHPFPEPDVIVCRTPGWAASREPEIRDWESQRPGQGAGGGRPRTQF